MVNNFINKFVQYIWVFIIILSVIAFYQPHYFAWMTKYTAIFLSLAMFGMGTSIKTSQLTALLKQPKNILIGTVAQYLIMPLAAFLISLAFNLPQDIAIGVILVGCCPGGTASNVITYIAKGNVSLSVAMTIFSTLLAPIITPLLIYFYAGHWVEINLFAMFKSVVSIILLPVILGVIANKITKGNIEKTGGLFPFISAMAIVLIIAGIIAANAEKIIISGSLVSFVVILHNLIGLLGGLAIARVFKMNYQDQTALAIEVGMQNSGLAVTLALLNFAMNPLATLPGAIFSIWHNISGSIFACLRRYKAQGELNNPRQISTQISR